jgi:hypothetical protein
MSGKSWPFNPQALLLEQSIQVHIISLISNPDLRKLFFERPTPG